MKILTQLQKIVAVTTVLCMVMTQTTWAMPVGSISVLPQRETPSFLRIEIPKNLASIEEVYEAPATHDPKMILHIQDLHGSFNAQSKTRDLLAYLHETYGFNTLFVEGASEKLNPEFVRMFQDKERQEKFMELLARDGELSGTDMFLSDQPQGVEAIGIEQAELYRKNYGAFKAVHKEKESVESYMRHIETRVSQLSSRIFDRDMRRLLSEWKKFEAGQRDFLPYVKRLAEESKRFLGLDLESLFAQVEWPQLTRLLVLQAMEQDLDLKLAEKEKGLLVNFLQENKVSNAIIQGLDKLGEKELTMMSLTTDQSQLEKLPRFLLERLIEEAGPKGFFFHDYPHFSLYAGYLILQSELDTKNLFKEIEKIFHKILTELAVTDEEKNMLELHKDAELLRKLFALELTRKDWEKTSYRKEWIKPDVMTQRIEDISKNQIRLHDAYEIPKKLPYVFETALQFYDYARQRDQVFFEKMQASMESRGTQKAVMISGGFHTEGVLDLLRENDINYGVLMPRLSGEINNGFYVENMMEKRPTLFDAATIARSQFAQRSERRSADGVSIAYEAGRVVTEYLKTAVEKYSAQRSELRELADNFNSSAYAGDRSASLDLVNQTTATFRVNDLVLGSVVFEPRENEAPILRATELVTRSEVRADQNSFQNVALKDVFYRAVELVEAIAPSYKNKLISIRDEDKMMASISVNSHGELTLGIDVKKFKQTLQVKGQVFDLRTEKNNVIITPSTRSEVRRDDISHDYVELGHSTVTQSSTTFDDRALNGIINSMPHSMGRDYFRQLVRHGYLRESRFVGLLLITAITLRANWGLLTTGTLALAHVLTSNMSRFAITKSPQNLNHSQAIKRIRKLISNVNESDLMLIETQLSFIEGQLRRAPNDTSQAIVDAARKISEIVYKVRPDEIVLSEDIAQVQLLLDVLTTPRSEVRIRALARSEVYEALEALAKQMAEDYKGQSIGLWHVKLGERTPRNSGKSWAINTDGALSVARGDRMRDVENALKFSQGDSFEIQREGQNIVIFERSGEQMFTDFLGQTQKTNAALDRPDFYLLLGNPYLVSFVNFANEWLKLDEKKPIVIAGGHGRGTAGLVQQFNQFIREQDAPLFDEVIVSRLLETTGVPEAEIVRAVLRQLGIPNDFIHLETESTNTPENFRNTLELLERSSDHILGDSVQGRKPTVGVVTWAPLVLRAHLTGIQQLRGKYEINSNPFGDRFELTDENRENALLYILGHPSNGSLNQSSEIDRIHEYSSKSNPDVALPEDFHRLIESSWPTTKIQSLREAVFLRSEDRSFENVEKAEVFDRLVQLAATFSSDFPNKSISVWYNDKAIASLRVDSNGKLSIPDEQRKRQSVNDAIKGKFFDLERDGQDIVITPYAPFENIPRDKLFDRMIEYTKTFASNYKGQSVRVRFNNANFFPQLSFRVNGQGEVIADAYQSQKSGFYNTNLAGIQAESFDLSYENTPTGPELIITPRSEVRSQDELLDAIVDIFGTENMISQNITAEIFEALAAKWDPSQRKLLIRKMIRAALVLKMFEDLRDFNSKVMEKFEADNPGREAGSLLSELAEATHTAWLNGEKNSPDFVLYTPKLHGVLIELVKKGVLRDDKDKTISLEEFDNPKKKFKLRPYNFDWNVLESQTEVAAARGKLILLLSQSSNTPLINTVAGEWDVLNNLSDSGQTESWSVERSQFLYGLQADSVAVVIGVLNNPEIVSILEQGINAREDTEQALVNILRKINAGWRINNPWGGLTDALISKPFDLEEEGGIGIDDILKDAIVLKTVLEVLHRRIGEVSMNEDVKSSIQKSFQNGLGESLNDLVDHDKLMVMVEKNRPNESILNDEFVVTQIREMGTETPGLIESLLETRSEVRALLDEYKLAGYFDESLDQASNGGLTAAIVAISQLGSPDEEITVGTINRIISEQIGELRVDPEVAIQIIAGLARTKNESETRQSLDAGVYTDLGLPTAFRTWVIFQRGGAGTHTNDELIKIVTSSRSEVRQIYRDDLQGFSRPTILGQSGVQKGGRILDFKQQLNYVRELTVSLRSQVDQIKPEAFSPDKRLSLNESVEELQGAIQTLLDLKNESEATNLYDEEAIGQAFSYVQNAQQLIARYKENYETSIDGWRIHQVQKLTSGISELKEILSSSDQTLILTRGTSRAARLNDILGDLFTDFQLSGYEGGFEEADQRSGIRKNDRNIAKAIVARQTEINTLWEQAKQTIESNLAASRSEVRLVATDTQKLNNLQVTTGRIEQLNLAQLGVNSVTVPTAQPNANQPFAQRLVDYSERFGVQLGERDWSSVDEAPLAIQVARVAQRFVSIPSAYASVDASLNQVVAVAENVQAGKPQISAVMQYLSTQAAQRGIEIPDAAGFTVVTSYVDELRKSFDALSLNEDQHAAFVVPVASNRLEATRSEVRLLLAEAEEHGYDNRLFIEVVSDKHPRNILRTVRKMNATLSNRLHRMDPSLGIGQNIVTVFRGDHEELMDNFTSSTTPVANTVEGPEFYGPGMVAMTLYSLTNGDHELLNSMFNLNVIVQVNNRFEVNGDALGQLMSLLVKALENQQHIATQA